MLDEVLAELTLTCDDIWVSRCLQKRGSSELSTNVFEFVDLGKLHATQDTAHFLKHRCNHCCDPLSILKKYRFVVHAALGTLATWHRVLQTIELR